MTRLWPFRSYRNPCPPLQYFYVNSSFRTALGSLLDISKCRSDSLTLINRTELWRPVHQARYVHKLASSFKAETMSGSGKMSSAGAYQTIDGWAPVDSSFPAGRDMAAGCDVKHDARFTKDGGEIGGLEVHPSPRGRHSPVPSFGFSGKVCLAQETPSLQQ